MSASFKTRVVIENLNILGFTKNLEAKMKKIIREGARRFMIHTLSRIPVDTGFLRGSFMNLEYLLGSASGRFQKVTRKASANKKVRDKSKPKKSTRTFKPKKQKDGTTTYERFIPSKGAQDVNDLNRVKELEARIARKQRKIHERAAKSGTSEPSRKQARKKLHDELVARQEELKLLEEAYRKQTKNSKTGKALTFKEYVALRQSKRYKTVIKLKNKSQRQINFYIANLVQARYDRARNAFKQDKAAIRQITRMQKQRDKVLKNIAARHGLINKKKKVQPSASDIEEKVRQLFPHLNERSDAEVNRKIFYHYSPGRTNLNRDADYLFGSKRLKYYYLRVGGGARILKTPFHGRAFGTPMDKIFQFSSVRLKSDGTTVPNYKVARGPANEEIRAPVMGFNFETAVRYLQYNDFRLGWNAWQSGIAAYNKFVKEQLDKESRIEQYVQITRSEHGHERTESQVRSNFTQRHRADDKIRR